MAFPPALHTAETSLPKMCIRDSYKGLMACESTGFLWCRRDLLEMTAPTYTAAGFVMGSQRGEKGWEITCRDKKDARKFENSSLDAPGIYSLDAGISCVLGLGVNNISEHIRGLYDVLYNGLLDLGITPVTPLSPGESCASIAFDTPKRPQDVYKRQPGNRTLCRKVAPRT